MIAWPSAVQIRGFLSFVLLQGINKCLGLVQGLLVINLMSKWDYGLYAMLLAVVNATANIGICGVGMFISSVGGRHVQDPARMASVYAAGGAVQAWLITASLCIVAIVLPWQYHAMNIANLWTVSSLTALGLLMMVLNARSTLCREALAIALQLHRNQVVDLSANLARLALILLAMVSDQLNAVTLVVLSLLVSATAIMVQDRLVARYVLKHAPAIATKPDIVEAKRTIFPQLPNAAYNSLQGQIPFILMGWLGSVQQVAELAALGRLSFLFTFCIEVMGDFFMPRIGRCQDPKRLGKLILLILAGFYTVLFTGLLVAFLFRSEVLWLLGSQYRNLEPEIPLMLLVIGITGISGSLFLINSARAWMRQSWLFIIATTGTQAASIPFLDLGSIRGMLLFGLLPNIPFIIINAVFILRGMRQAHRDL
ncbi:MAG TPA: hypothetical protein VHX44_14475 [Planctomycetota bacterium]|nr:hypothetical protein [Planctomycetota bacterium]